MPFYRPDIVRTFELFHQPGEVVEVRVPKAKQYRTISGYFNNAEAFADAVMSQDAGYPGVYFTINKSTPDIMARASNTLIYYAETTTSDKEILTRRWLPIDLDPVRPSGISSTDEEHGNALDMALKIRKDLVERGWSKDSFIMADSGNGAHLMVRIDLTNDPTDNLIERCLKSLDYTYSNEKVKVDTTLTNASRIMKVYGTTAKKGSDVPDRPHRNATILEEPETLAIVAKEQLEALVAELTPAVVLSSSQKVSARSRSFDPVAYAEKHGAKVIKTKPWNGGLLAILESCPFDPSHCSGEIYVGRMANGARSFKCFHDSCKDKHWQDLKAMWEPGTNLNLADLKLDDLCIGIEKKDQIEYRFDPDKAAKAILSTGELQLAEWESRIDESDIWVCVENNVWARSGEYQIEKVCDDVAGSRSTGYSLNEVKRRVRNALRDNPIDFDTRNPCLVGTKNGYACNLITGEVRKILPDDYISTELQLPVDYDPNARCPETFKFYDSICITDCERLALLDFDVSALMLKYRREIHQRLGGGANGKGHMQKHQRAFFGTNTIFSITLKEFTDDKFAMQNLFRKRILILPETTRMGDNGKEHSTSAIKSITGGDQQDADVKFKSRIKFVPFCKVVMDANTPPRFDDNSAGWTSRYRRENFPFEFTDTPDPNDPRQKKDDPQILNRITTPEELSGYLNVLLYRAQTVIRDGIVQKCGHLTKGYNEQVFSLEEFIKRFLILDSTKGVADNYYVVPNDLFKKFDRWAELMNGARMKEKSFFNAMTNALGTKAQQFWLEGKNQRVYVGAKFDAAKYETAIDELEEALGHSGYCGNSAETYEDLKTKFAYS